jgi:uncharacterized protein HemX
MATIATKFSGFFSRSSEQAEAQAPAPAAGEVRNRLRSFPNEDIYFHVKHIDNSAVIRQTDPAQERASFKMIAAAGLAAAVLICVLMPKGYGVLAGYQIQTLREEQEKLMADQAVLELREASLMSPERMQVLAKQQQFVDPAPEHIVYLNGQAEGEFASVAKPQGRR